MLRAQKDRAQPSYWAGPVCAQPIKFSSVWESVRLKMRRSRVRSTLTAFYFIFILTSLELFIHGKGLAECIQFKLFSDFDCKYYFASVLLLSFYVFNLWPRCFYFYFFWSLFPKSLWRKSFVCLEFCSSECWITFPNHHSIKSVQRRDILKIQLVFVQFQLYSLIGIDTNLGTWLGI